MNQVHTEQQGVLDLGAVVRDLDDRRVPLLQDGETIGLFVSRELREQTQRFLASPTRARIAAMRYGPERAEG